MANEIATYNNLNDFIHRNVWWELIPHFAWRSNEVITYSDINKDYIVKIDNVYSDNECVALKDIQSYDTSVTYKLIVNVSSFFKQAINIKFKNLNAEIDYGDGIINNVSMLSISSYPLTNNSYTFPFDVTIVNNGSIKFNVINTKAIIEFLDGTTTEANVLVRNTTDAFIINVENKIAPPIITGTTTGTTSVTFTAELPEEGWYDLYDLQYKVNGNEYISSALWAMPKDNHYKPGITSSPSLTILGVNLGSTLYYKFGNRTEITSTGAVVGEYRKSINTSAPTFKLTSDNINANGNWNELKVNFPNSQINITMKRSLV